jgi:predicted NBD/HSP70 family sugar kinase
MLGKLVKRARRDKLALAPFIGIGCPGRVRFDGLVDRGAQNLPGQWRSPHFNLPIRVRDGLPRIGGHDTVVVMHNDAVVQGLSEAPRMRTFAHWAVLTIGTGLGNAVFANR